MLSINKSLHKLAITVHLPMLLRDVYPVPELFHLCKMLNYAFRSTQEDFVIHGWLDDKNLVL